MNIPKFEHFFRAAASLGVDKEDRRRYDGFAGGLGVALARSFKIADPNPKNPASRDRDNALKLFDLLQ